MPEAPPATDTTAAKKIGEAPGTPPPAVKADGESKEFTLQETTPLPEHESVSRFNAERAKWKKVFALILDKITRANGLKKGPGNDMPALDDPPVRPYVNDDRMTIEKNNVARVRWEFQEHQLVLARQSEKKEAVLRRKPALPVKPQPTLRKQNYTWAPYNLPLD